MPGSEVVARDARPSALAAKPRRSKRLLGVALLLAIAGAVLFLLSRAGSFLIIHAPEPSDVIVVLDGEWPQAVKLQKEGYAPKILLDAGTNRQVYGRTEFDLATEFLKNSKPAGMELCPTTAESTLEEAADVHRCLEALHATSALLVASDFDTRRALEIYRARLPQYRWSMAASSAPYHDADQYWKYRSWAKSVLNAWEQYLWWKLVDERRPDLALR